MANNLERLAFGPSTEVATGYETRLGFAGAGRAVVSYQSHPEMVSSGGTPGLDAMQMASAQQMQIGDFADIEAGGTLYVVRSSGFASGSRPFLKITAHPVKGVDGGVSHGDVAESAVVCGA